MKSTFITENQDYYYYNLKALVISDHRAGQRVNKFATGKLSRFSNTLSLKMKKILLRIANCRKKKIALSTMLNNEQEKSIKCKWNC